MSHQVEQYGSCVRLWPLFERQLLSDKGKVKSTSAVGVRPSPSFGVVLFVLSTNVDFCQLYCLIIVSLTGVSNPNDVIGFTCVQNQAYGYPGIIVIPTVKCSTRTFSSRFSVCMAEFLASNQHICFAFQPFGLSVLQSGSRGHEYYGSLPLSRLAHILGYYLSLVTRPPQWMSNCIG